MCTAKYLRSANQLNEASKHLLNKKQTGEQQSTSHPINQPTNQPTSQITNQPASQPTKQPKNQPTNHPANQPTNQPINQQHNQPNNGTRRTISVNANAAGKDKYIKPSLMYELTLRVAAFEVSELAQ